MRAEVLSLQREGSVLQKSSWSDLTRRADETAQSSDLAIPNPASVTKHRSMPARATSRTRTMMTLVAVAISHSNQDKRENHPRSSRRRWVTGQIDEKAQSFVAGNHSGTPGRFASLEVPQSLASPPLSGATQVLRTALASPSRHPIPRIRHLLLQT
jgi:hypothetical protein